MSDPTNAALPRWGVMLPTFDPYRTGQFPVVNGARVAEDAGFDAGWVGDHLSYVAPCLEPFVALAAAAGATTRLRLGMSVLLLPLRPVVWVAKQLGSLAAVAPGRVILGVGVGGENPAEWEAAGVPLNERGRRLDEALEILPALLRGKPVGHPGPLLPLRTPALEPPVPEGSMPIVVGGRSQAAVRRTARYADGWMGVWLDPAKVTERKEQLEEAAAEAGRPAPEVIMMVFTNTGADVARGEAEADTLFRGQYGIGFDRLGRWAAIGPPGRVAEHLDALSAAGANGFVFVPASPDPIGEFERLAEVKKLLGD
jgi:alkanesulfonate monooxygenase SsuD/methylene tetrahydromethanopterin reductase-like flavin-dependent oxidoreductase (luciferase family)